MSLESPESAPRPPSSERPDSSSSVEGKGESQLSRHKSVQERFLEPSDAAAWHNLTLDGRAQALEATLGADRPNEFFEDILTTVEKRMSNSHRTTAKDQVSFPEKYRSADVTDKTRDVIATLRGKADSPPVPLRDMFDALTNEDSVLLPDMAVGMKALGTRILQRYGSGGKPDYWASEGFGEDRRRAVRLGEMMIMAGTVADMRQDRLAGKGHIDADRAKQYYREFTRYVQNDDLPATFRADLMHATDALVAEYPVLAHPPQEEQLQELSGDRRVAILERAQRVRGEIPPIDIHSVDFGDDNDDEAVPPLETVIRPEEIVVAEVVERPPEVTPPPVIAVERRPAPEPTPPPMPARVPEPLPRIEVAQRATEPAVRRGRPYPVEARVSQLAALQRRVVATERNLGRLREDGEVGYMAGTLLDRLTYEELNTRSENQQVFNMVTERILEHASGDQEVQVYLQSALQAELHYGRSQQKASPQRWLGFLHRGFVHDVLQERRPRKSSFWHDFVVRANRYGWRRIGSALIDTFRARKIRRYETVNAVRQKVIDAARIAGGDGRETPVARSLFLQVADSLALAHLHDEQLLVQEKARYARGQNRRGVGARRAS